MRTYTVRFLNDRTGEIEAVLSFKCERYTNKQHRHVIKTLFMIAGEGDEKSSMVADVFECRPEEISKMPKDFRVLDCREYRYSVYSETFEDEYPELSVHIMAGGDFLRRMTLAR